MDAVLGNDCVNDVCSALKNQSSIEGAKCVKQTQVPEEDVGRGGQCKWSLLLFLRDALQLGSNLWFITGLTALPGDVEVTYK